MLNNCKNRRTIMKILAIALTVAGLSFASLPASAHMYYTDNGCCVRAVKVVKVVKYVRPCCRVVNPCSTCGFFW